MRMKLAWIVTHTVQDFAVEISPITQITKELYSGDNKSVV